MAEILLERLHKSFAGATAVEAMDLRIADGELMVFVGPSGCGKSTTLRLIAGLEPPTSGRILFGDREVTWLEPKDRNVAMVFQNYALYPHKSVFDNLAFGLQMRRTDKTEIRRRVLWAAEMLGIEHFLERKPRQLSGGQMQRVALGRALVREPDVFLLDEPLSNLDAKLRVKMRDEIARLHRKLGRSMVYVTHDQVEAMTLGDRVVVMRDGRVQQVGTPLEIYDHPANLFVAGFIGAPEINLIRGECHRIDDEVLFESGQLRIPLPRGTADVVDAGRKVTFGIRPEHVRAGDEGVAGIPAEVVLVEQMGASTLAIYDTGENELRVLSTRDDTLRPGLRRRLVIEPGRGHVFDQQSGEALAGPDGETTTATMPGGGDHDQENPRRQAR